MIFEGNQKIKEFPQIEKHNRRYGIKKTINPKEYYFTNQSNTKKLIYEEENRAIFRLSGKTGWSGVGMTKYYYPILYVGHWEESKQVFYCKYEITYNQKTRGEAKKLGIKLLTEEKPQK